MQPFYRVKFLAWKLVDNLLYKAKAEINLPWIQERVRIVFLDTHLLRTIDGGLSS